ncbi:MAG TPA: phosphoenolpyruvate carboxylase [Candidatus Magasanikbacteria bacterium]|nr:MAG: phosphoenolpyruvate carboxylase [Candidatus Magasanikbacteria bacterium RIFOXYC2_FULL_39_8]HAT03383.1 phosphoenolpyruvate carboxylase [Candidatus Magasanikbacteria bacterium]
MYIPKTMSTQHPDNVRQPFFVENGLLGGEDEVQEAFYAFSHLGCDEQMWDFEGKEVDNFVVKKLLTKNESFFREKKLGQDVRLTLRVPNPEVEKAEAKMLLETLESIPRSYDAAKLFYGSDIAPIFEIILPMTTSAESLNKMYYYYKDFVVGKQHKTIGDRGTIREWIGEFKPEQINVIPLFEDKDHLLRSSDIVRDYLKDKEVEYQRVFLARSDPAVNYGNLSAILLNKIALQRLHKLSQELGISIYPILGVGSAPFRGNFRPETVDQILKGYPSVQTFTIQSSFKFDNAPDTVQRAINRIQQHEQQEPVHADEEKILDIIDRFTAEYQRQLMALVPVINAVASHVPKRRKRKLHVGLFGYSRAFDDSKLPRAITFTASLYSLGIPPELLGLNALSDEDIKTLGECYGNFEYDMRSALTFYNPLSPFVPLELKAYIDRRFGDVEPNKDSRELTDDIANRIKENPASDVGEQVLVAAHMRGFLG